MPDLIPLVTNPDRATVTELTAAGRGAICVLAVSGHGVPGKLQTYFRAANRKPLADQSTMKPVYGRWGKEDIVVCVHSDQFVEVHCHGGDFAKLRIVADLETIGFSLVPVDGAIVSADATANTAQAALLALAKATTEKSAAILTWQSEGALDKALHQIERLAESGDHDQAIVAIDNLLKFASVGLHTTSPWKVAIAGAANAGKSSLINQIVGYTRSIVMDMPGTTRDLVSVETAINGWPVQLTDTAGLRDSNDQIEQSGVALAEQAIGKADLVIEVIDATSPVVGLSAENVLRVWNKCDLASPPPNEASDAAIVALTGEGVEALFAEVALRLVPCEPTYGAAVPFLVTQVQWLEQKRSESIVARQSPP